MPAMEHPLQTAPGPSPISSRKSTERRRNRWSTGSAKFTTSVSRILFTELTGDQFVTKFLVASNGGASRRHTVDLGDTTGVSDATSTGSVRSSQPSISRPKLRAVSLLKNLLGISSLKSNFSTSRQKPRHTHSDTPAAPTVHENDPLQDICLDLSHISRREVDQAKPESTGRFSTTKLCIRIKTIDAAINLDLPPPIGTSKDLLRAIAVGDEEEQQDGGTCDTFVGMLPERCRAVSAKASPLGLVPKLLPHGLTSKEARYVGSCFWMWLCIVDDLTENTVGKEWDDIESDLLRAFSPNPRSKYNNINNDAIRASLALRQVIDFTTITSTNNDPAKETSWRKNFMKAIHEIISGFRHERPLLAASSIPMESWMRLRMITISVRPFLILTRADLGLMPTVHKAGNPLATSGCNLPGPSNLSYLRKIETLLQLIMGLQNDILGWEKDAVTNNPLSAIQIQIAEKGSRSTVQIVVKTADTHNELVKQCMKYAELLWEKPGVNEGVRFGRLGDWGSVGEVEEREKVKRYLQLILGFANGMAMWMAVSKRYMV